ncbi:hypothetical protein [Streptomyces griseoluteus]
MAELAESVPGPVWGADWDVVPGPGRGSGSGPGPGAGGESGSGPGPGAGGESGSGAGGDLLHARGFGSVWRTGRFTQSERTRHTLGLSPEERLLGWLYIGTPHHTRTPRRRTPEDITDHISVFTPQFLPL